MDNTAAAVPLPATMESFVEDFSLATVQAFAKAKGKAAVAVKTQCRECEQIIRTPAFRVMSQIKKYGKFVPFTLCKRHWDEARRARLAARQKNAEATVLRLRPRYSVPPELEGELLEKYRKKYEEKHVTLTFKQHVSFSNDDESLSPEHGTVIAVARKAIIILGEGDAPHAARSYGLCDIAEITVTPPPSARTSPAATPPVGDAA